MALQKQPIQINFAQGLDTKTDPKQVPIGRFAALENSIFDKGGLLQKRNGYKNLAGLPDSSSTYATTFNGNLTAIGTSLNAYSLGSNTWIDKGSLKPALLDTLPLIRSSTNQVQADAAVASNGLVCTVYTDVVPSTIPSTTNSYKFAIADSTTGQNILAPQAITVSSGAVSGAPRVFVLGSYFVIVFTNGTKLQYITVSTNNPTTPSLETTISSQYTPTANVAFDGVVANNTLYLAWNGSDVGGAVRLTSISSLLVQGPTKIFATYAALSMSMCADNTGTTPVIYVSFYSTTPHSGYTLAVDTNLVTLFTPVVVFVGASFINYINVASAAASQECRVFFEESNTYAFDSVTPNDTIYTALINQAGTILEVNHPFKLGVGLASKAFAINGEIYVSTVYQSVNQSTYFVLDSSAQVVAKIAYSNASGYYNTGIPNVTVTDNVAQFPYLIKDFITTVTKNTSATNASTIYTQTGVNLAILTIGTSNLSTAEIGNNLNISGGIVWAYDGVKPVEQGFFLWPDTGMATWQSFNGAMHAQPDGSTNTNAYFYQYTYEWSDNQGNIFRSAPSIPLAVTTTGSGTTGSVVLSIPTLRLTYKANVKIVIYRWSVAQQSYHQVTYVTSPLLNDPTIDYVNYTDTLADPSIVGNSLIYTTGGVIENIGPPSASSLTLFKSRLFLVDSEDKNLLWYSKQVIEGTPVEMSDLFTLYVAPTTSANGATGPITALSAMDDKLIVFKKDAIYYIVGTGPDNTGANNDFSEPVFITSTVGCANQQSIVFMPQGLMFQSDKGIWLLGRDLSTTYIGAPVEEFNPFTVDSAVNVPATNQVRFTLSNGTTLMYDYFFGQWGTFSGVPAVSSTIYESLHTFINSLGQVYQETPGLYLDGTNPVLMSFTTSWFNMVGLQGYQRVYMFYLLGTYMSPHKLALHISYDYEPGIVQQTIISPDNYSAPWGGNSTWGASSLWGGTSNLEQWKIHLQKQTCQSFKITVNEIYDSSYGVPAGAGLTLSGITCQIGLKKGFRSLGQGQSAG